MCSSRTEHCWFPEWSHSRSGPVDLGDPSLPSLLQGTDLQKTIKHQLLVTDCEDVLLLFIINVSK